MPVNGCEMPHSRFWIASANENASRFQPNSVVIGSRKSPRPCRTPIAKVSMMLPQTRMVTSWRDLSGMELCAGGVIDQY